MAERLVLTGTSRSGTTITRKILNGHPEICMTNEGRLYWEPDNDDYFQFVYERLKRHVDLSDLTKLNRLKKTQFSSLKDQIEAAEKIVFADKDLKYFGDKGLMVATFEKIIKSDILFQLIIIHRDGRDAISSSIRRRNKSWFSGGSINQRSKKWAAEMGGKMQIAERLGLEHVVIKFEDYFDHPGKNMGLVQEFLGVEGLLECEKEKINRNMLKHVGYYKEHIPNWRKEFHPNAIKLLEELGYI